MGKLVIGLACGPLISVMCSWFSFAWGNFGGIAFERHVDLCLACSLAIPRVLDRGSA